MNRLAGAILRSHRLVLIGGTSLLAIAASRLSVDLSSAGAWITLVGGACLMYTADLASEMESEAQRLARSAQAEITSVRQDVLAGRTHFVVGGSSAGVLLIAAGFGLGIG